MDHRRHYCGVRRGRFRRDRLQGHAPTPAQSQAALTTSPTAPTPGGGSGPSLVRLRVRLPERVLLGKRFGLPGHNSAGQHVSVPFRAYIPLAEPVDVYLGVRLDVYLGVGVDVHLYVYLRVAVGISVASASLGIDVGEHILLVGAPAPIDARFHVGRHIPVSVGTRFHVAASGRADWPAA